MIYSDKYKKDWGDCFSLFKQWWNRENRTPLVCRFMQKENVQDLEPLVETESLLKYWTDIEWTIDRAEDQFARQLFAGTNFPYYAPSLGPGSLALFLGCTPKFRRDTVWYEPCFDSVSDARAVLKQDNCWYEWTKKALLRARQRSENSYALAMPDIIEGLDCVAEMVGNEKTLCALLDEPDQIHRLLQEITNCYHQVFEELYSIVSPDDSGNSFMAFQIIGDKRVAKFQSDISAMLSPANFDEFVVPYLKEHTKRIKYSLYHLDGPQAIRHVDSLCKIDTLNAIQWVPGEGNPPAYAECWYDLYDKILSNNKGLQVVIDSAHLEAFTKRFDTKGIYILSW